MERSFPWVFSVVAVVVALAVPSALVVGSLALADGIRDRGDKDVVTVTGSAKRAITSDVVVWRTSITSQQETPADASRELAGWTQRLRSFLTQAGVKTDELRVDPVTTEAVPAVTSDGRETGKVSAYKLSRYFEVRSRRVDAVAAVIEKSSALLDEGIPLAAQPPEYLYTKLAAIRPDLLAEATRDALGRGKPLVEAAGGRLGKLRGVRVGVFQITPTNSTDVSDQGVYDTTTKEKDVTAVVRLTFALK